MTPVINILFIPTIFNNDNHTCKPVRVYEDGTLVNSTDVTNFIVEKFRIYVETNGVYSSWYNVNNEEHNLILHNMVREVLIDINPHENK